MNNTVKKVLGTAFFLMVLCLVPNTKVNAEETQSVVKIHMEDQYGLALPEGSRVNLFNITAGGTSTLKKLDANGDVSFPISKDSEYNFKLNDHSGYGYLASDNQVDIMNSTTPFESKTSNINANNDSRNYTVVFHNSTVMTKSKLNLHFVDQNGKALPAGSRVNLFNMTEGGTSTLNTLDENGNVSFGINKTASYEFKLNDHANYGYVAADNPVDIMQTNTPFQSKQDEINAYNDTRNYTVVFHNYNKQSTVKLHMTDQNGEALPEGSRVIMYNLTDGGTADVEKLDAHGYVTFKISEDANYRFGLNDHNGYGYIADENTSNIMDTTCKFYSKPDNISAMNDSRAYNIEFHNYN